MFCSPMNVRFAPIVLKKHFGLRNENFQDR